MRPEAVVVVIVVVIVVVVVKPVLKKTAKVVGENSKTAIFKNDRVA